MEANSGVDLCRVTVVAPRTRMDLALPTDAPLADLLPTLLRFAGENPEDPTFLRGGWILQRLGEEALDASQRLGNLGVRDGDVLYLRHREAGIPEFAFDDVADAITTATRNKRAAWSHRDTQVTSLLVGGVFFALGGVLVLTSGPSWVLGSVVALLVAAVLLAGGWALSRAYGQAVAGGFVGAWGVAYAGLGGLVLLGGNTSLGGLGAVHLAVGSACALVAATIAALAIVTGWNGFFGAAATALLAALAALAVLLFSVDAAAAAAVLVAVALGAAPLLPTLCARLARLPIPQLPTSSEELRRQADVLPGPTVLHQALTADRMMAGLLGASAAIVAGASIYIAGSAGWFGAALVGVAGLALVLRARHFRGRTQRLWLIGGGIVCGIVLVVRLALGDGGSTLTLLAAGLPCLLAAGGLAAWSLSREERRLSPYWGRLTDVVEVLVLLAVVPLTLGILGVYSLISAQFA